MIGAALVVLALGAAQTDGAPAVSAAPVVTEAPPAATPLAQAESLVNRLRCDDAIVALEPLVAPDTLARAERRHALFLLGYCLAVVGRGLDADERFRAAWTLDLDSPLGFEVEPNVQFLIRAARDAVVRAGEEERRAARESKRAAVKVRADAATQIAGGRRLYLRAELTDPQRLVTRVHLEFRREGERERFTLPMQRDAQGAWFGEVPGLYTLTPAGPFTIAWRVVALDDEGPLADTDAAGEERKTVVTEDDSLVPELRASERLPHSQRVLYSSFGYFSAVALTGVASVAGIAFATTTLAEDGAFSFGELGLKLFTALVPPVLTTTVSWAAMEPLIDGELRFLSTAIVFAGCVPALVVALAADPKRGQAGYVQQVGFAGVLGGGLSTAIAAGVATAIVTLDPPLGAGSE